MSLRVNKEWKLKGKFPECDKMSAVKAMSQAAGEFIVWLGQLKGISLCRMDKYDRYYPIPESLEKLLAECYGIDLDKVERERREMLVMCREKNQ